MVKFLEADSILMKNEFKTFIVLLYDYKKSVLLL